MNKAQLNFVIDALMFLCMMAMAGLGFLMKYVLLPGRESAIKYGRRVDLFFLGLDRHDWGAIHLYLGFLLLALLALHIVLHWQMIPGLFARLIGDSGKRWRVGVVYVAIAAVLLLFPFFISPRVQDAGAGEGRRHGALEEKGLEDFAHQTIRDRGWLLNGASIPVSDINFMAHRDFRP